MEDYEEYFSQAQMYTKIYAIQEDSPVASKVKHPTLESRLSMPAKIEAPYRSSLSSKIDAVHTKPERL